MRSPPCSSLSFTLLVLVAARVAGAAPTPPVEPWVGAADVWRSARVIELEGDTLVFPNRSQTEPQQPEFLEVTLRYVRHGVTHVVRYRTPGCGETLDLVRAEARLGCGVDSTGRAEIELTLDSFVDGQGFERTRIDLKDERVAACLRPECGLAKTGQLELWPEPGGHRLSLSSKSGLAVESHQILFEVTDGRLRLNTNRRGGGVFRADQLLDAELEGRVAFRNGRLLYAAAQAGWAAEVDPKLHSNDGTELTVTIVTGAHRDEWTEIDGTYRRAQEPTLQRRFDDTAPDPTTVGQQGVVAAMRQLAGVAFKKTMRYLRPSGPLVEVSRRESEVEPGVHLVRVTYARQTADGERLAPADGDIETVGLKLDGRAFKAAVRAPCSEENAVATINGFTFKYGPEGTAPLPDAGLVLHGRVLGRLRTNPWYSNLVVDTAGRTWVENAHDFFLRHGFDAAVDTLIQGTTYLQAGHNQRLPGDNPEVNWRSAIGIAHGPAGDQIVLGHTLLPVTNLTALTAYGRGLTQFEMAELMSSLGATDALILDGGSGAAFRFGEALASGGLRELPLCIAIERRRREP